MSATMPIQEWPEDEVTVVDLEEDEAPVRAGAAYFVVRRPGNFAGLSDAATVMLAHLEDGE